MSLFGLQSAVYQRLIASTELANILASNVELAHIPAVYDHHPQSVDPENDEAFPYIIIDIDAMEWDTDTSNGHEAGIDLHVYDRYGGNGRIRKIQDICHTLLHEQHEALEIDGGKAILLHYVDAATFPQDGFTYQGQQSFTCLMEIEL